MEPARLLQNKRLGLNWHEEESNRETLLIRMFAWHGGVSDLVCFLRLVAYVLGPRKPVREKQSAARLEGMA